MRKKEEENNEIGRKDFLMGNTRGSRFPHSCSSCQFLGQYDFSSNGFDKFDLYVCGQDPTDIDTVIARFGDRPGDYMSGLEIGIYHIKKGNKKHPLAEALRRAKAGGVL